MKQMFSDRSLLADNESDNRIGLTHQDFKKIEGKCAKIKIKYIKVKYYNYNILLYIYLYIYLYYNLLYFYNILPLYIL